MRIIIKIISILIIVVGLTYNANLIVNHDLQFQNLNLENILTGIALEWSAVLFHELGHGLAALIIGGKIKKIIAYPWRGYAKCEFPESKKEIFFLGGPIATIVWFFIVINIQFFDEYELWISFIMVAGSSSQLIPWGKDCDGGQIFFGRDDK